MSSRRNSCLMLVFTCSLYGRLNHTMFCFLLLSRESDLLIYCSSPVYSLLRIAACYSGMALQIPPGCMKARRKQLNQSSGDLKSIFVYQALQHD